MADPDSVDEWLLLVGQHAEAARLLSQHSMTAAQAVFHVGVGVECAIKALIMSREQLNGWPSRASRPDIFTHDLRRLLTIASIDPKQTGTVAPSWHVVLQWDRNQGYDPRPMPLIVARQYVEAAFGQQGVATWIREQLQWRLS